jgi:hypothetical protein
LRPAWSEANGCAKPVKPWRSRLISLKIPGIGFTVRLGKECLQRQNVALK